MNNKLVLLILAVVVIAVSAAAVYAFTGDDDGEDEYEIPDDASVDVGFKFDNHVRLAIAGNANGDDSIDSKDIDTVKAILSGKQKFDIRDNSFADANYDGKIDTKDLEVIQDIIDGKPCRMYYWSAAEKVEAIDFPLRGLVGTHHMYPIDVMIILGLYDSVVGTSHQTFGNSISTDGLRYPGMGTKIKDVGSPWESCEAAVAAGINVWLEGSASDARDYTTYKSIADKAGLNLQVVRLNITNYNVGSVEFRGTILMLGEMFQAQDKAHEYVDWADGVVDYIQSKAKSVSKDTTFITPCAWPGDEEIVLDTVDPDGNMMGDVYTISMTGMKSVNTVAYGLPTISMEQIYKLDPDVIVLILFHTAESTSAEIQDYFEFIADSYKNTNAYKNGKILGVNYYHISGPSGPSELVLLASYLWPDLFSEEKGWEYLQYYYDHFTNYNVDVKDMGNAFPYQLP